MLRIKRRTRSYGLLFDLSSKYLHHRDARSLCFEEWEADEIALAKQHVDPHLPVVEIGGGLGVVSCIVNKMLLNPKDHVVLEPDEKVVPIIEANRRLNGARFELVAGALHYGPDGLRFEKPAPGRPHSFLAGQTLVATEAPLGISTVRLSDLVARWPNKKVNLIMDAEGAEVDMVRQDADVLRDRVERICIELHPNLDPRASLDTLDHIRALGFLPMDWKGQTLVFYRSDRAD